MTPEVQKEYNKWYWEAIATPALERILNHCKSENKHLTLQATPEDLIPTLMYLKEWESRQTYLEENIKRDLIVIRNFEGYEALMAA